SEDTILDTLLLPTPQEAVDRLVELALKGGGPDNITCVVADVVDTDPPLQERPLVAGAAAEKKIVPGAAAAGSQTDDDYQEADTAAARGARVGRMIPRRERAAENSPADDETSGDRPNRRILVAAAAVLVFVVGGAIAGWAWVNSQYYVGVSDGRVAVFNGVYSNFPGVPGPEVVETFAETADLEPEVQASLDAGIDADSRDDAIQIAEGICPAPEPEPADTDDSETRPSPPASVPTGVPTTIPTFPNLPVPPDANTGGNA
nr:hypothetical protein [Micromonospora sp. DSM 115978]